MEEYKEITDWQALSPEEKKKQLFLRQKALLDAFLARNAIFKQEYDKSLSVMKEKMGI